MNRLPAFELAMDENTYKHRAAARSLIGGCSYIRLYPTSFDSDCFYAYLKTN